MIVKSYLKAILDYLQGTSTKVEEWARLESNAGDFISLAMVKYPKLKTNTLSFSV